MFQIGNERVALVTDTSCDLSDEQLSQYDIRTVALRVATSQGEFRDRLEITQEQLYDLLQREVPKTSLPLPEDVSNLYRTLHDEGATSILHLSISGSLSGTFNMVSLLAEDFEDMKIHVFDSKTLSCGLGLLVLEAGGLVGDFGGGTSDFSVMRFEPGRNGGLEAIPLAELGRPRIDVTVRISGFFRDAFPHVIAMLDDAVTLVAGLDEPDADNFQSMRNVTSEPRR